MSTPYTNVQQPVQRILQVTAQAWKLALPARACAVRPEAAAHRRPLCRAQAPCFAIAY
jgi:hypothetical protein